MSDACRCGWDGRGDHPCHRCHAAPGTLRFYSPYLVPLSGMQMKFEVRDTNACDPCWEFFQEYIAAQQVALDANAQGATDETS